MKKRIQVVLTEEAWAVVEDVTKNANENFDVGAVGYSDAINEMILTARVDIDKLRIKHTDVRRSLRSLASKEMDLDSVIKHLHELKSKLGRKKTTALVEQPS